MRTIHSTPQQEATVNPVALDSPTSIFILRSQLKREKQALESRLKAIDDEIRPMMLEGETFGDTDNELYILSVETSSCDWKALIAAGLLTQAQLTPYIKRTISTQIRSRKAEPVTTYEPGSNEDIELRKRLDKAGKGLVG